MIGPYAHRDFFCYEKKEQKKKKKQINIEHTLQGISHQQGERDSIECSAQHSLMG